MCRTCEFKETGDHAICKDCCEQLQELVAEMAISITNLTSIVDPKKTPICGNIGAANQARLLLDEYEQFKQKR